MGFLKSVVIFNILVAASLKQVYSRNDDNYFQQEVNNTIEVFLDDIKHELRAFIRIEYINNSPDSLGYIYFHLWPNAYSGINTGLAQQLMQTSGRQKLFRDPDLRGFIDSIGFVADNQTAEAEFLEPDICRVILPSPLAPSDTIIIETPFRVKLPQGNISRMGFFNGVYQVSQWYPKPAVYDKNGWHPISYLDQGEFYSEFGRFDVTIILPEDYVVGASGELTSPGELAWLQTAASEWRNEKREEVVRTKTIHYFSEHSHDFAWVASTRFRVLTETVILPGSGKEVTTMTMFTGDRAYLWEKVPFFIQRSLIFYSELIGEYPYDVFTAVQAPVAAGSGMEYPGLTFVGNAENEYTLEEIITHEVCHSWFYSALGSDERRYPFMDESLSSAYEKRYMDNFHPGQKFWELVIRSSNIARLYGIHDLTVSIVDQLDWLIPASQNIEQPVDSPADRFTAPNYSSMIYNKGGQAFNFMRSYLGDQLFDSIMQDYFRKWNGKHPSPDDLEKAFMTSGKDLDWFFSDILGTVKRTDYAIKKKMENSVIVKNSGEAAPPFMITGLKGDREQFSFWSDGFHGKKSIDLPGKDFTSVVINNDRLMPEINLLNNNIHTSGLLRKRDPFYFSLFYSVYDPAYRPVFLTPLVNWNRADGFMAGFALSNSFVLARSFEYSAIPFIAFRERKITGKGGVLLNYFPYESFMRRLSLSLEGSTFGFSSSQRYYFIKPGIEVQLNNANMLRGLKNIFALHYIKASDLMNLTPETGGGSTFFTTAVFAVEKETLLNPWESDISIETGKAYMKVSSQLKYRISYYGRNNGLEFRLYAGTMLKENPQRPYYSLAPSARNGRELYMFQGDFPDRFSPFSGSFWSRQMLVTEGGIISPVNEGTGFRRWLLSLSVNSSLPGKAGKIPVKPFVNFVVAGNPGDQIYLESGVKGGIPGLIEIYFPFLVTENIRTFRPDLKDRIRFVLSLESFYRLRI